jgi:hypothetical protein
MADTNVTIEFSPIGFDISTRSFLWFRRRFEIVWDDVVEIRAEMKDCFAYHVFGLRFMTAEDKGYLVCDDDAIWPEFYERVQQIFPAIDQAVIAEIQASFPSEWSKTCWRG